MNKLGLLTIGMLLFFGACKRHNIIEQKQWASIFAKYHIDSICFELADNSHEQVFYYNMDRMSKPFSPASTFKIMNSLIGLETNVANDENFIIKWDGITRREEWNKDLGMREAFKVSCVPYYQELARRIGEVEMQNWLDSVKYGNMRMGGVVDNFWLNDTLKISADEQVGFLKKLYFDKLPFSQRTQRLVRSIMLREDSTNYRLYYKTGTRLENETILAWVVGFVERKETQKGVLTKKEETNFKPYFFAMNFETKDTSDAYKQARLHILHDVLRERHIID
jgi:beta-lactamase class D